MLKINGHKFYNVQKGLSVAEYLELPVLSVVSHDVLSLDFNAEDEVIRCHLQVVNTAFVVLSGYTDGSFRLLHEGSIPYPTNWDRFPSASSAIAKAREYYGSNMCVRTVMGLSKSFDASLLHEGVWDVTYANDGVTDPVAVEVTHLI